MNRGLWLLLLVPGVYFVSITHSCVDLPDEGLSAHDEAEARRATVRSASLATIAGAEHLQVDSTEIFGEREANGDHVTFVSIFRRHVDFAGVEMDDARGGPVRAVIALAEAQAKILGDAGFQPIRGGWRAPRSDVKQPLVDPDHAVPMPVPRLSAAPGRPSVSIRDEHQHDSGGGSGGSLVDLDAPRLTSYRMYILPNSAATLFVRNDYDNATNTVFVEFSWCDRTLRGVEYPPRGHIVGREPGHSRYREWIEEKN